MGHGPTYYPSKGICIYCGVTGVQLKDEHVVPYSLGGKHVLREASCARCEKMTTKFERQVARDLWGDARTSFDQPTRRKRQRKTHIEMSNPNEPSRKQLIPAEEYPGGFVFYKMGQCGFVRGLPETTDLSGSWQLVMVDDEARRNSFFEKHGHHAALTFRHVPDAFGRLLAKIGYCQVLTALDPLDFRAFILPYIKGEKKNISYLVGSKDGVPDTGNGYRLTTFTGDLADRMILMVEVRLYANTHAPTYEIVVGDVLGDKAVQRARDKLARAV
jgi:hypothetical protein